MIVPLGILLFGVYLRLRGVLAGTFGFTHDQGRDLLAAWSIKSGDLTLIGPTTGLAGVFHGPLWYWILGVFSFFGSGDVKFILAGTVLLFAVVQLWLFLTVKKFHGFAPAILTLAIISFSPFFLSTGGQLWSPNMVTLTTMIAVGALIGIANGKKWYWLLALALGANIQFEAAGGIFLLVSTIGALSLVKAPKIRLIDGGIFIFSFLATLLPQILFEVKNGFLMTQHIFDYIGKRRGDFIADYGVKTVEYKSGLFFDNFNKIFFGENVVLNLLFILAMFLIFIKIFVNSARKRAVTAGEKLILVWSTSVIFLMFIVVNLYTDVVWHHFLGSVSVLFVIIIAFLISLYLKIWPKITSILIILLFLGLLLPIAEDLKAGTDFVGDHSVYRNQLLIIDEIYTDAGSEEFNVVVYEPTTFSYTYDYLLDWYGNKRWGRVPVTNDLHQRLVYYVIEPDDIGQRRAKWVRERDGDGQIVWQKEFFKQEKVGRELILQKRIRNEI